METVPVPLILAILGCIEEGEHPGERLAVSSILMMIPAVTIKALSATAPSYPDTNIYSDEWIMV
jgi:hypothetical protein